MVRPLEAMLVEIEATWMSPSQRVWRYHPSRARTRTIILDLWNHPMICCRMEMNVKRRELVVKEVKPFLSTLQLNYEHDVGDDYGDEKKGLARWRRRG